MPTIEDKIKVYQTPPSAEELVRQTKIVLLVGIAGAGKDTIKKRLLESGKYHDIVSHTTRPPRVNNDTLEQPGVHYHFISLEDAEQMVDEYKFIEVKFVHGTVYGTSVQSLEEAKINDAIAITDLDVQGVDEYKEISHSVIAIFIVPPSFNIWLERLRGRYPDESEFLKELPKRRDSAIRELKRALSLPYYHFIVNDSLDAAVKAADSIATGTDTFHRKDDEARLQARDLLDEILSRQN
jgi:guanylate kinase